MLYEALYHKKSGFVTLTYSDEHIPHQPFRPVNYPVLPSLSKSDFQKHFKRLRKRISAKLRFYAAGEYGDRKFRPHYHYIIFGADPFDYPFREERKGEQQIWYAEPGNPFHEAWGLGNVNIGFAQPDSINYVAQYIDKKRYGESALFGHYQFRQSEFQLQSLGIGKQIVQDDPGKLLRKGYVLRAGQETALPRYFQKKAEGSHDVRAMDFMVFAKNRHDKLTRQQVEEANNVADLDKSYRDMTEEEFDIYVNALYKRNQGIRTNLIAKGLIKEKRL